MGALLFLLVVLPASAHVGSPDVFLEDNAGPYRLFVTIRVPQVIPGIAQIEIRSESPDVRQITLAPMQLTGPGSQYAPAPDVAERSRTDPQFFTGSLWLMEFGSLQVRLEVSGTRGTGVLSVPVPAVAQRTMTMAKPLGALLFGLMILLAAALISIAAAAVREGSVLPGTPPDPGNLRRARLAWLVAGCVVVALLVVGAWWWNADARAYARNVYSAPEMQVMLEPSGQLVLREKSAQIASGNPRRPAENVDFANLLTDHGHLMHFFMIRMPAMDSFWHLHPERSADGSFVEQMPHAPPGHYELFADVVLGNGFPVTMLGQIDVPDMAGKPLAGPRSPDDSGSSAVPLTVAQGDSVSSPLPGGGRMVWERGSAPLKANVPMSFHFRVEDSAGRPANDLEPYMGMAAHAAIVRSDGSVFAHVHPSGSVAMAAFELANSGLPDANQPGAAAPMASMPNMPGMIMPGDSVDPDISFPYGFPKPGRYRIFVQVKRAGQVETGIFDADVQ